ncbi:MAG: hypothetical protein ACRDK2_05100 [Solirubrobacteraceae bacterium]
MSANARTLPLREAVGASPIEAARQMRAARISGEKIAGIALFLILSLSLLIVLMAADRPSFLSAITHAHFFPRWMAGPLGGLWPGLTRNNTALKDMFTGSVLIMYVSYLVGLRYVTLLRPAVVIGAVLLVHAILLLAPPMALTDIFNYVNYGRMEMVHHLNPYTTIPTLEPHSDPSFALSNWHHLLSPYGPLFTLISIAVVPLGVAGSFWAFKGILMLASLGIVLLVYRCALLLGRNPVRAVMFVGLNPVVLIWGLGGDHNDFIMVFFIMLGFYLLLAAQRSTSPASDSSVQASNGHLPHSGERFRADAQLVGLRRWLQVPANQAVIAGVVFAVAVFVKASAGLLIPVVLCALCRTPRRLLQFALGLIVTAVLLGILSLIAFGPNLPDLSTQSSVVTTISLPNLLGLALGQGGETGVLRDLLDVGLICVVVACCRSAYRRGREFDRSLTAAGWATVALLVTLSWVLPWYVVWLLPLAALSSSQRLRRSALVLGAYLILAWVPSTSGVFSTIGFKPATTPLGQQHQRAVKELLN